MNAPRLLTLLAGAILAIAGCSHDRTSSVPPRGVLVPRRLDRTVARHVAYDYLLYFPETYDPHRTYPLVIFLHGVGERGTDVAAVKAWGPPKLIEAGQQFQFILVAPQCPPDRWWRVDDLEVLLADVVARYPVDRTRMYLTGLSMGGCATWEWLLRDPHTFAAAVPVCGWGNPVEVKYARPDTPVWAFHGTADPVVPVEGSRLMVEAFRSLHGPEAKLTLYPGVGHNAWTPTYANPEVFRWLLSKERVTAATVPVR